MVLHSAAFDDDADKDYVDINGDFVRVDNRVRPVLGHSHQIYDLSVGRRQLYM